MKIMTSLNFFANSSNVLRKRHVAQLCHFAHSKFANRPLGSSHKIRIIYFDWILELIFGRTAGHPGNDETHARDSQS